MTPPVELLKPAQAVMNNAHSPYSNFKVGAALRSTDGQIFTGCNVENASYGLTICAERNAVFAAIATGIKDFTEILIVADSDKLPYPCGACRQVLSEFCPLDFNIYIVANQNHEITEKLSLGELLPKSFTM